MFEDFPFSEKLSTQTVKVLSGEIDFHQLSPGIERYYQSHFQTSFPFSGKATIYQEGPAFQQLHQPGPTDFVYSRSGDPKVQEFEDAISVLEGGIWALGTASGMAAISTTLLGLTNPGDIIVASQDLYPGTLIFLGDIQSKFGREVFFVNLQDLNSVAKVCSNSKVKVVMFETPSNPLLYCVDIENLAGATMEGGNKPVIVCDNTFATPILQNPLEWGADIVIHSCSKFISAGLTIAGAIIGMNEDLKPKLKHTLTWLGGIMSPETATILLHTLPSLQERMDVHQDNTSHVNGLLANHEKVERVYYPSAVGQPGIEAAHRQMPRFGSMVGFEIKGGRAACARMVNALELCKFAVSLGTKETLFCPFSQLITDAQLEMSGLSPGFVRLSVGLEKPTLIFDDLERALAAV